MGETARATGGGVHLDGAARAPGLERIPVGHIRCDQHLLILEVDLTARRILTRRRDQLLGQPFLRYLDEDDVSGFDALARRLVVDGLASAKVESRVLPLRGAPCPVTFTVTHLPALGMGEPAAGESTILLVLEPLMRSGADPDPLAVGATQLDERSPDLITRYRLWPEPGFDYVSPSAQDVLGYPPRAFYADPWLLHELIEEPDEIEQLQKVHDGWEPHEPLLLHVQHRSGHTLVLEQRSTRVLDGEGQVLAIESIARDVTARAEEQTRYATAAGATRLFRELGPRDLDGADPATTLRAALEAACTYLGWPVGHGFLLDADPGYVVSAAWHEAEPSRSAPLREHTVSAPVLIDSDLVGEAVILVEQVVHALPDAAATERSMVAAASGYRFAITVPVTIEGGIGALLEFFVDGPRRPSPAVVAGVADLADEVGRALERSSAALHLRQLDQARQEFVARAAHELRGPVGSIALMAAALAHQARASEHPEMAAALDSLSAQAERIQMMATQLLELSQLEEGRVDLRIESLPVDIAMRAAVAALPATDRVRTDLDVAPSLDVLADAGLLDSILSNLLANAVRFARSAVLVEATALDDEVSLVVSDDGPGVPPELQALLFEPMKGALATSDHGGLGLALVAHAATAMGGCVRYEAAGGVGARFVVTLPAVPEPAPSSLSEA